LKLDQRQRDEARVPGNCSVAEVRLFGVPVRNSPSERKARGPKRCKSNKSKDGCAEEVGFLGGLCFPFMASIKESTFVDMESLTYSYGDEFW
jgi:hypothetical protein